MLALAYLVKYHTVNVENTPIDIGAESTIRKRIRPGVMVTHSSPFLSERQIEDDCIQFDSEGRTRMAYSSIDQNTVLRTQRYPANAGLSRQKDE